MKRLIMLVAASALLVANYCRADLPVVPPASACSEFTVVPYVGADMFVKHFKAAQEQNSLKMISPLANVYAGLMVSDYLGFELGTSYKLKHKSKNGLKAARTNYHASVMGFLPLRGMKMFAGYGLAHVAHSDNHRLVPRIIVGSLFDLTDQVAVRTSVVWENDCRLKLPLVKLSNALQYGLGLQYKF